MKNLQSFSETRRLLVKVASILPYLLCALFISNATIGQAFTRLSSGGYTVNYTNALFTAHASAALDVDVSALPTGRKKGILIPRVQLQATNSTSGFQTPIATSLLVYNVAPMGSGSTAVVPGFYYYDGTKWLKFGTSDDYWSLNGNANATSSSFLGTPTGVLAPLNFKVNGHPAGHVEAGLPGNTLFGYDAGNRILQVPSPGSGNTAIGNEALYFSGSGSYNTGLGFHSLRNVQSNLASEASRNTGVGALTMIGNVTGTGNTAVGFRADVGMDDLTNATAIGANCVVNASNSMVLGDIAAGTKVGIGIDAPTEKLEVANGDILLSRSGTNATGQLQLQGTTTSMSTFQAGTQAATINYTLPTSSPSVNQVLTATTVSGPAVTLEWQASGAFNHYIGQLAEGGIIFYLYRDAGGVEHGLVASLTNVAASTVWSSPTQSPTGATSSWDGMANSNTIAALYPTSAAKLCRQRNDGGYTDWYLPASDELLTLFGQSFIVNKVLGADGFSHANYWSSTEYNYNPPSNAISHGFGMLGQNFGPQSKTGTFSIRAVRHF